MEVIELKIPVDELILNDYIIKHFGDVQKVELDHPSMSAFLADLKKDGKRLVFEIDKDDLPGVPFTDDPAIGDRVIVPAWVDGYGKDHTGTISEILKCCDVVSYSVMYDTPNERGETGKVVSINHIRKSC